ncbi:DUF2591 domain-containing protein [Morganella morganii]|nr:DUF2591 domain-containing protein [Morganella morganii]
MNKYRDKSDFEINKAVAIARGAEPFHNDGFKKSTGYFHKDAVIIKAKFKIGAFDPCNNPADAMPIIIENGIGMNYIDKDIGWCAYHFDEEKGELEIYDKNYYRAAMICFLIMKDEENEKI